jgi:hypothetical protein
MDLDTKKVELIFFALPNQAHGRAPNFQDELF